MRGNRYFMTLKHNQSRSLRLFVFRCLSDLQNLRTNVIVNIPSSVNRSLYQEQGVGHQFAHGGGSLQELVVPLIESSRKLKDVTKKVTPKIINKGALRRLYLIF